jgi:putative flavoprotein involved in K+ transport
VRGFPAGGPTRSRGEDILDQTATKTVNKVLAALNKALTANDAKAAAKCFEPGGFWRDLASFTWNIKTLESAAAIEAMVAAQQGAIQGGAFKITPGETPETKKGVIEAFVDFETRHGWGHGHIRIRDGKIHTLLTTLDQIKGHEERKGPRRPNGVTHGADKKRTIWAEERAKEIAELGTKTQPHVVIIGGGQGGIALGARLRQLDVPTIIVEKNERAGDSWRKRYKSLCLHDPVWYDHLPYIKFPDNWPVFAPKDKIGDWLEMYTKVMELNYWTSTTANSAKFNARSKAWEVTVARGDGSTVVLKPKHLVFATGMSGHPNIPDFEGMDVFAGEQHHSSRHPGPDGYKGKKVVVIGSNNSAHDICAACYEAGIDVTMVQRSSSHVVKSEVLMTRGLGPLYSEEALAKGITLEKADILSASTPYAMMAKQQKPMYDRIRKEDAEFYAGLKKAGFMLDFGDDDSGLTMKFLRRGSGYYIDVGASQLIIDGKIKLKSGSDVSHLTKDSVVLKDGTRLKADLVVYATGYGSMNEWVADLIDRETADRIGKVWGLGSGTTKDPGPWEGEQRGLWKPTHVEGLWLHGGNLHQSRHYSQFLALQLKARQVGIPTPVYGLQDVHHTS